MINHRGRLMRSILVASAAFPAHVAVAQEVPKADQLSSANQASFDSKEIEDIVVTATRKAEPLSRVPISVAAYDQTRLDTQNVRKIDDIVRLTPGLQLSRTATVNGNISHISLRGISSDVGAATTGIYINDTPIQTRSVGNTATNAYPLVFDLERVEVLRGPQGTLFGASSEGGAVRFITPKPDFDEVAVYGRSELSSIDGGGLNYEGGAAVGVPLIKDKLAIRASAWYRHDGGWVDRVGPLTASGVDTSNAKKNVNTQKAQAFKLDVSWRPAENITITPSIYYQRRVVNDTPLFLTNISNAANRVFNTALQTPQKFRDRFLLPAFLIEANLGDVKLIANTSYFDRHVNSRADLTYIDSETFGSHLPYVTIAGQQGAGIYINRQKTLTQEVRLQSDGDGPFSWVVGGFYSRAKQYQYQDIADSSLDQQILDRTNGMSNVQSIYGSALLPGYVLFHTDINTTDKQLAGFIQGSYEITDKLKLTAGARISRTEFSVDVLRTGPLSGGRVTQQGNVTESPVTPKFGLSYQIDPGTLLYASAAKGFRPGGAQAALSKTACAADLATLGLAGTPTTYKSDNLWSYEVGAKKRVGNIVQIEASGYVVKWKNIQQTVILPTCGGHYIANTGSVTSRGFDVSMTIRPTGDLTLGMAIGYTDATFDDVVYTVAPHILKSKGSHLPIPPLTLTISGEYDFDILKSARSYVRFDFQHVAGTPRANALDYGYDSLTNVVPGQNNLDLRIGTRFDRFDIALFATNVTNDSKAPIGRTFLTSKLIYGLAPRPRTIGLTASYRY